MNAIYTPALSDYILQFRHDVPPLIEEMERDANSNNIPIIHWQGAQFLEMAVLLHQPMRILEFGTAIGYSAIRMAVAAAAGAVITTIEKSPESVKRASEYINRAGFADRIRIMEGEAAEIIPRINELFDMIFLDADKEDYLRLFELSLPLLRVGGVYVVDNLLWHGYTAARDEDVPLSYRQSTRYIQGFNSVFLSHPALKSLLLPIGDGIGFGIKLY
jgi:predicted O-methyltransferase YrrM